MTWYKVILTFDRLDPRRDRFEQVVGKPFSEPLHAPMLLLRDIVGSNEINTFCIPVAYEDEYRDLLRSFAGRGY